jgi:hypothetical protein
MDKRTFEKTLCVSSKAFIARHARDNIFSLIFKLADRVHGGDYVINFILKKESASFQSTGLRVAWR